MLPALNMIHVVPKPGIILMDQTIFATIPRTTRDLFPQG